MTKKIKDDGKIKSQLIISAKQDTYKGFLDKITSFQIKAKKLDWEQTINALCVFYGLDWANVRKTPKAELMRRIYLSAKRHDLEIVQPNH